MLNINLICVGKLKEKYWREACEEYAKRLSRFCRFMIIEVDEEKLPESPSASQIEMTLKKEGQRILSKTGSQSKIIAMCIEGKIDSSEELSEKIEKIQLDGCGSIDFIIGGSWGLSEEVKKTADFKISMSRMTFPHQMARVILCEQIYRSFQIASNGKYHK